MKKHKYIDEDSIESVTIEDSLHCKTWAKGGEVELTIKAKTYTEGEIVKPYLDKLKAKMKDRDDDNGGEPMNAVDKGYHLAYEHLCNEIEDLLKESEGRE